MDGDSFASGIGQILWPNRVNPVDISNACLTVFLFFPFITPVFFQPFYWHHGIMEKRYTYSHPSLVQERYRSVTRSYYRGAGAAESSVCWGLRE